MYGQMLNNIKFLSDLILSDIILSGFIYTIQCTKQALDITATNSTNLLKMKSFMVLQFTQGCAKSVQDTWNRYK